MSDIGPAQSAVMVLSQTEARTLIDECCPCFCLQDQCKRGEALLARLERWDDVSSADLHVYEVKVHSFWAQLQDFSQRVNSTGQNMERAVRLYRFLDQVL